MPHSSPHCYSRDVRAYCPKGDFTVRQSNESGRARRRRPRGWRGWRGTVPAAALAVTGVLAVAPAHAAGDGAGVEKATGPGPGTVASVPAPGATSDPAPGAASGAASGAAPDSVSGAAPGAVRGAVPGAGLASGDRTAGPGSGPGPDSGPGSGAVAADPVAPFAKIRPESGPLPVGRALTVEAEFHNTLDTPITDSFIVAVGLRLAPPAAALTPRQVVVEWYDAGAAKWRSVELTQGAVALSGFLTVDGGLPSTGSIPAKGVAKVRLRLTLDKAVPVGEKLQFVVQGLIQFFPGTDPVPLMDGKASYDVKAAPLPSPRPIPKPTPSNSPSPSLPPIPSGPPNDPVDPGDPGGGVTGGGTGGSGGSGTGGSGTVGGGPLPQTGTGGREELAATGVPLLPLALGAAGAAGAGTFLVRLRARTRTADRDEARGTARGAARGAVGGEHR